MDFFRFEGAPVIHRATVSVINLNEPTRQTETDYDPATTYICCDCINSVHSLG